MLRRTWLGILLLTFSVVGCGPEGPAGPAGHRGESGRMVVRIVSGTTALPADGVTRYTITARVELGGARAVAHPVRFVVEEGAGTIASPEAVTDHLGEARTTYVAGETPGLVRLIAVGEVDGYGIAAQQILHLDPPELHSTEFPGAVSAVTDIALSPDGARLAVGGPNWSDHLYTMTVDGTDPLYVGSFRTPSWAPDGSGRLLVRDTDDDAFVIDESGTVLAGPSDLWGRPSALAWVAGGDSVLVIISSATHVLGADLSSGRMIPTPDRIGDVSVTPDGAIFAVGTNWRGQLMRLDLEAGEWVPIDVPGSNRFLFQSVSAQPGGDWILLTANHVTDDGYDEHDLYLVRRDGTDLHPLLASPFREYEAHWTPDGASVLFLSPRSSAGRLHRWTLPPGAAPARVASMSGATAR